MITTKDKLYNASIGIFNQKGFEATSLSEIAKKTGIAKSSLFTYFDTKQDLFNKLFLHCKKLYGEYHNENDLLFEDILYLRKTYEFALQHKNELEFLLKFEFSPFISDTSREIGLGLNSHLISQLSKYKENQLLVELPIVTICLIIAEIILKTIDYVVIDSKINEKNLEEVYEMIMRMLKK